MGTRTPQQLLSYHEFRRITEEGQLGQSLRNAVLIFFLLQTFVFIPADWVIFPENFRFFLAARLILNAVLCLIYFVTSKTYPVTSSAAVCVAGELLFLAMVYQTGGASSGYYVGLILLVIGMGVLTPLTWRQGLSIASLLFFGYAALPLYAAEPVVWPTFWQHLFFLGAACLEATWACAYVDRISFADWRQQRELEQARDELAELDRAKARFSANVHHELRTPLTLILAPLDSLRAGDYGELSPVVEKTLKTMHANGRRLYKMINNLLDLSKVESSQFEVHRRPIRLEPLVDELVTGALALAERKGVELSAQGFAELPEINADPEALEKVLVNLMGNALKFTDAGDRISISAELQGDRVAIAVTDTGIGIPPDQLDSVFDRFAQVDGSATRRHEGTGIGLSLAKEMVELHGGRIWAESEGEGRGTSMRILLPIGESDEGVDEEVLEDDQGGAHRLGRSIAAVEADLNLDAGIEASDALVDIERSVTRWEDRHGEGDGATADTGTSEQDLRGEVLIAEDNPDMRALLSMLVGKEFRVRVARNGREALESLQQSRPNLVLSDVMMPEMSGIELCRAIKQDEETRNIPVVLVTSKAEREMKIEGLELGADDYVTKPFHPRELMARVRSLVRVASLQQQLERRNDELEVALGELKQAEVQLVQSERLAAVGELAAGIAHEVNNPVNFALNAVRAMGATVLELRQLAEDVSALGAGEPEEIAKRIQSFEQSQAAGGARELADTLIELSEIVGEGLKRTSSLVGDLRDFAAPGRAGQMHAGVDVEKGLRSTIQLLKHTLEDRNATVELEVDPGAPRLVGDSGGLNQVFLNLVKNAAEASTERGASIRITLHHDTDAIEVIFEDDGPGVPDSLRGKLFEPFFTTKEAGEGTGLGLSISRQIVAAHGGTLELDEAEAGGARFTVRLPLKDPDAARGTPSPE